MLEDEKLAVDESRRVAHHEAMKGAVRSEVNGHIADRADRLDPADRAQTDAVADEFRHKAVAEVVETENEIERARGVARIAQVVDYLFYLIYAFIGLMILLDLMGANRSAGFYRFINGVTAPLLAPFRGLIDDPSAAQMRFRLSYLVALIAYFLLHLAINGLLRMIAHRRTSV
jgi:uncharacterized protein YggT (Ycf19 family)